MLTRVGVEDVAKKLGMRQFDFSEDVFKLFYWMESYDKRLSQHGQKVNYFSQIVSEKLNWQDRPEGIALTHGTLLHDLGKLSFTQVMLGDDKHQFSKEEDEIKKIHPALGAYLFWHIVQELPFYADNDPESKKKWFQIKDMITASILYHHPEYGDRKDKINEKSLIGWGINIPRLSKERFRKVAIVSCLIDTAVATLENRNGDNKKEELSERIKLRLDKKLKQYNNRLKKERKKIPKKELNFYQRLVEEIAKEFPSIWDGLSF